MKVRLLTGLSGAFFSLSAGDEYEFELGEALRLIERGIAEPIGRTETAVQAPIVETTDAQPRKRRRRK